MVWVTRWVVGLDVVTVVGIGRRVVVVVVVNTLIGALVVEDAGRVNGTVGLS